VKVSFGTRLESGLRQRLKVFAAVTDRTIEDVVEAALDHYLPPGPAADSDTESAQDSGLMITGGAR
jgi:predicted transcriptional regulator